MQLKRDFKPDEKEKETGNINLDNGTVVVHNSGNKDVSSSVSTRKQVANFIDNSTVPV